MTSASKMQLTYRIGAISLDELINGNIVFV